MQEIELPREQRGAHDRERQHTRHGELPGTHRDNCTSDHEQSREVIAERDLREQAESDQGRGGDRRDTLADQSHGKR